jgi:DNA helicase HerA-like ATPase
LCRGWVPFDPHQLFCGRLDEAFAFFCEWAWEMSAAIPGQKVIIVDEVWKRCSPHSIPIELANIVHSGRKRGLHLLVNTQEPNRINSSILGAVSESVCFRLQSRLALDVVESYGFERDEVSGLEPMQFVARNLDSGGELRGRIRI